MEPEPALQRHLVDFDDHTVDFVGHLVAMLAPVVDALLHAGHVVDQCGVLGNRQAPGPQRQVRVVLGGRAKAFGVPQPVADHPQLAAGGDRRILLAQRSRGAVARVGERRLARLDQARVERLEVRHLEEHLAAHLEDFGHRVIVAGGEPFGDVVDGAGVERDVLAGAAVAPGRRPDQPPVAVDQRQCDAVDLEFAQVVRVVTDLGVDPGGPGAEFLGAEGVVEAQHPFQVLGRLEIRREARAADQLGGRIGRAQLGMLFLERL